MKTVGAVWTNGHIVPDEPVDWPEGCRLTVGPARSDAEMLSEQDWSTSPEAIAAWLRWYESLEPLEFTPEEERDLAAWRQKMKEHSSKTERIEGLFR